MSLHQPASSAFAELACGHDWVPVCRRLLCDGLTPVSAFKRLDRGGSACLFESVVGGEKVGRYSFLAVDPFLQMSARGSEVTVLRGGAGEGQSAPGANGTTRETYSSADPLEELRSLVSGQRIARLPELPPFTGGAIGYCGYDVVRYVEHLPNAPEDDRQLPDLSFALYDALVVFDNVNKTMSVIALANTRDICGAGDDGTLSSDEAKAESKAAAEKIEAAYRAASARVDAIIDRLSRPEPALEPVDIDTSGAPTIPYRSNCTQDEYEAAVRKSVEYIRAGDIFQVVLSQRLAVDIQSDPFEIYRTLRVVNPSPFMFFLRTPEVTLVGSSPEIMCRVVDGKLTVRPLAGTRPRGRTEEEDRRLAEELLADPKERAEHVMLVDLGRNDVGRVARFGTVSLTDVMTIERYSHVMHITSNVTGELVETCDAFDALRACLPAGTVSGAPKVRAMEIIDELEKHRRGPYAGAVGYFDFAGNMDTCIALRTIVIQNGIAYVQAGAGLVADSDPTLEYQETMNKARGLLKAIEITERRRS